MKASWLLRAAIAIAVASSSFALPTAAQDRPRKGAPAKQDDEPPPGDPPTEPPPAEPSTDKPAGRELDTTSPEAQAVKELLHVDPRYAKDGTVELVYEFDSEAEMLDWQHSGFDLAETRYGALTLGAGSQGQGLMQHCLAMQGQYEVVLNARIEWMSSRSDLVFILGKGGGRYGNQFVEKKSSGFKPVAKVEPAKDRWSGARDVTLRYVVNGDDVTVWINGAQMGTTNKLKGGKLDGKFGMWMTDMRLVIQSVTIKGRIDASKL